MASAAALKLGVVTIPVYEIYKVGEARPGSPGLDLLGPATGLQAAVVPHYDNAEGGNHDTRFCYIGERRLRVLERALPAGAFVLGVDSHTALVLDLERRTAAVLGARRGHGPGRRPEPGLRPRHARSRSTPWPPPRAGAARARAATGRIGRPRLGGRHRPGRTTAPTPTIALRPLRDEVAELEGAIVAALADRDSGRAVAGLLALDEVIERRGRCRRGQPGPPGGAGDLSVADRPPRRVGRRGRPRSSGAARPVRRRPRGGPDASPGGERLGHRRPRPRPARRGRGRGPRRADRDALDGPPDGESGRAANIAGPVAVPIRARWRWASGAVAAPPPPPDGDP